MLELRNCVPKKKIDTCRLRNAQLAECGICSDPAKLTTKSWDVDYRHTASTEHRTHLGCVFPHLICTVGGAIPIDNALAARGRRLRVPPLIRHFRSEAVRLVCLQCLRPGHRTMFPSLASIEDSRILVSQSWNIRRHNNPYVANAYPDGNTTR